MRKKFLRPLICLAAGLAAYFAVAWITAPKPDATRFGATFSIMYSEEMGLDWRETFTALLDDLRIREFRIPLYWNRIEKEQGAYSWEETDWLVAEAEKRGAKLTLVVGRKTPRWPDCHEPQWVWDLDEKNKQQLTLRLIREEVARYKGSPAVTRWQVENEPLFDFGLCPPPDRGFLKEEVAAVRTADDRPVMVTDSGELSTWMRTAPLADTLGFSLYRRVYNPRLGYLFWPITPRYYSDHMAFVRLLTPVREIFISELQAEPWFNKPFKDTSLEEQYLSMDVARFTSNVAFARRTGADTVYLWGPEWWYWLKTRGEEGFWEAAKPLFRATISL